MSCGIHTYSTWSMLCTDKESCEPCAVQRRAAQRSGAALNVFCQKPWLRVWRWVQMPCGMFGMVSYKNCYQYYNTISRYVASLNLKAQLLSYKKVWYPGTTRTTLCCLSTRRQTDFFQPFLGYRDMASEASRHRAQVY